MIGKEKVIASLSRSADFRVREIRHGKKVYTLVFLEGMVDHARLCRELLPGLAASDDPGKDLAEGRIPADDYSLLKDDASAVFAVLRGHAVLFAGFRTWSLDIRKTEKRSVSAPDEENAVKASKDSFVEDLKVNLTLLRKKLVSSELTVEGHEKGVRSHTALAIVYMHGLTDPALVKKVRAALEDISVDGILTPGVIEQALTEKKLTVFPRSLITERPDKVCRNLLEGRVAVFADGLPLAFLVPATLSCFLSTPEDYSGATVFASCVRLLRYALLPIQLLLPGLYVAVSEFHYGILPRALALSMARAKTGVPFPALFEVLAMLALFEVLIEAGLHMPRSSGQAVSVVGALVVGEAAIEADLVSPAALITVAISAIASFAVPDQRFSDALRLFRLLLTLLAGLAGLFGLAAGLLGLLILLASAESYGVAYLAPLAGKRTSFRDTLVVVPERKNPFRPHELHPRDPRRAR